MLQALDVHRSVPGCSAKRVRMLAREFPQLQRSKKKMCNLSPHQKIVVRDIIHQFCIAKKDFTGKCVWDECQKADTTKGVSIEDVTTEVSKAYSNVYPYKGVFPIGYVVQRVSQRQRIVAAEESLSTSDSPAQVSFKIYHWSDYARRKNDELFEKFTKITRSEDLKDSRPCGEILLVADGSPVPLSTERQLCKNCKVKPVCYDGAVNVLRQGEIKGFPRLRLYAQDLLLRALTLAFGNRANWGDK